MIEVIKQFFGNSVSAVEAWVAGVGLSGIILFLLGVFNIVRVGKKLGKSNEEVKAECNKKIEDFKEQTKKENEEFRDNMKKNVNNLADMLLIESSKQGVDLEKFKAIIDIYKDTASELLDTDKLVEEKQEEIAQEQTTQEQVNENIKNIEALNDLV